MHKEAGMRSASGGQMRQEAQAEEGLAIGRLQPHKLGCSWDSHAGPTLR